MNIKSEAFWGCKSLTSIKIPYNITSIESNAFLHCNSLTSIKVDTRNKTYDSRKNCNAIIDSSTNMIILGCSKTIIPNGVTKIGSQAFYACKSLKTIDLPDSVTCIEHEAFCGCIALKTINLSNNVTNIERGAFASCTSLKTFSMPKGVTQIETDCFQGCKSLTTFIIGENVLKIDRNAFYKCDSLIPFDIPKSVVSIHRLAFLWNKGMQENIIRGIENDIFLYDLFTYNQTAIIRKVNSDLETIKVPEQLKFDGNTYRVASIDDYAFFECKSLTTLYIGSNITYVDSHAFNVKSKSKLTNIHFDGTKKQWEHIISQPSYISLPNNVVIHCNDGDIYFEEGFIINH